MAVGMDQNTNTSSVLVVVPTYNEAGNIKELVQGILRECAKAHILFVDDNSNDGTLDRIAEEIKQRDGAVHLLRRERKLGLGTAYIAGFQWGLARRYQALVEMDADLSHRPLDLPRVLAALETNDVAIGSRYIKDGGTRNWGIGRKIISRVGSFYARTVLGLPIRDLTGGFNAWRRDIVERINISDVKSEGYTFQIELKFRASLAGARISEVPILFEERRAGQSKMSLAIVLEAIVLVWYLASQKHKLLASITSKPEVSARS